MNEPLRNPEDADAQSEEIVEMDDAVIGRAFKWSLLVLILIAAAAGGTIYVVTREPPPPPVQETPLALPERRAPAEVEPPVATFTDVTKESGIQFVHRSGAYGKKLLPETMGSGAAFFDYDNDGDQDLLLVNSMYWPGHEPAGAPRPTMGLFQNDGSGKFADVTSGSGLDVTSYGMGVAVGDYDNDGWVDVFLTAVGPNRLLRNQNGKFVDVTKEAGVAGAPTEWSSGAAWFDADNDGDLDLFVCNYIRWSESIDLDQDFRLVGVGRAYGPPAAFEGTFPYLYRNDGKGKFTDISATAGIQVKNPSRGVPMAKSLGIAPVDFDGDGWMDLLVANDTVQNFVFRNNKDGTFREIGAEMGVAFDSSGNARGAMGIDTARFRNDGSLGVSIGNFANEMTALYVSQENSILFTDEAIATGLGPPTRLLLTFGLFFFDYDLDGRLDLFAANGHLEEDINKVQSSQSYAQPPQLFWNAGPEQKTEFIDVPAAKRGTDLSQPMVGRGAAYADIEGDGDLDILATASNGPPRLLRNDQKLGHHWLRLKLVASRGNRDAIGAIVTATVGGKKLQRQVMPTRSYLSQVELPVTIGLGMNTAVEELTIRWPDGSTQKVEEITIDRPMRVEQKG